MDEVLSVGFCKSLPTDWIEAGARFCTHSLPAGYW